MADYLVQEEDGTSRIDLEESTDSLILETTAGDGNNARVSQDNVEVLVVPDTQKARVSQDNVEVLAQPNTQLARVSQVVVEVLVENIAAHTKFFVRLVD